MRERGVAVVRSLRFGRDDRPASTTGAHAFVAVKAPSIGAAKPYPDNPDDPGNPDDPDGIDDPDTPRG